MAGTVQRISGPAFLANAAANVYTPPASTFYVIIRQIHLANVDTTARDATLYIGATGGSVASTTILPTVSIPPKQTYVMNTYLRMNSTDFLSGLASLASTVTITVMGDQVLI